jgi:hypothetical protein
MGDRLHDTQVELTARSVDTDQPIIRKEQIPIVWDVKSKI